MTYLVNVNGEQVEAGTVAKVKELLGDHKVTKKAIEAGEYPMVTLATGEVTEVTEVPTTNEATGVTLGDISKMDKVEVIMVGDAPKAPITEPTDTVEEVDEPTESTDEPTETTEVDEVSTDESTEEVETDTVDEGSHPTADTLAKINEGMDDDADTDEDTEEVSEPIAMVDKAELAKKGFVVGATVMIDEDSEHEELLTAFLDADIDQAIIKAINADGIILDVEGLTQAIPAEDLAVIAPPKKPKTGKVVVDPDKDGYPEVGHFTVEADMKKYIKALTNEQLQEWCELEGATWNPHDNVSINRMRMAMSIKAKHFPHLSAGTGGTKKSKSKYGHLSNEDLAKMCLDNDVEVRDAKGDTRIERMYMIMDLRNSGVIE